MEYYYRFAGVEISVSVPDGLYFENEQRMSRFRVHSVREPEYFRFAKVDTLTKPEGECIFVDPSLRIYRNGETRIRYIGSVLETVENAYIRAEHRGRYHFVQLQKDSFPERIGTKTVLNSMEAEHLIAQNGGFVLHCAFIVWQGQAILFTAPSGTGKSTQAELWKQFRGAEIINGDRAAVRMVDGEILAEGIPFSGSSEYCLNASVPLAAVVYLSQAPQTSIRRLQGYEAFARIWEGCSVNTWDREDMSQVSGLVQQVAGTVPVFYLPCTPDETAVTALENAMRKLV